MKATYQNPWILDGQPFESESIGKNYGFVYLITHIPSGKMYVGRKYFHNYRKAPKATRRKKTESDWKTYYGSNEEIKELVKEEGEENFRREILRLYESKGGVNYGEVKEQFERRVLESDDYYNDQINGKWYKKNVRKYYEDS